MARPSGWPTNRHAAPPRLLLSCPAGCSGPIAGRRSRRLARVAEGKVDLRNRTGADCRRQGCVPAWLEASRDERAPAYSTLGFLVNALGATRPDEKGCTAALSDGNLTLRSDAMHLMA